MRAIGIDIGTTTICGVCIESEIELGSETVANNSFITGKSFEKIQNPEMIIETATAVIDKLIEKFSPVDVIGITGQMHGIVYVDKNGEAVSPLYTWQDESGNEIIEGKTYAKYLSEITGYKMATGFGLTTFFYHTKNNEVPENAEKICTIHDYFAMKICKNKIPVMHISDAASFGIFDLKNQCFDVEKIKLAGMNENILPEVTDDFDVIGSYKNISVTAAVGDNQASFMGSVKDMENSVLVNVGTGSQVSFYTKNLISTDDMELRPLNKDGYILVGSSLCGGRAFARTEQFIRETVEAVTGEKIKSAYKAMDGMLEKNSPENPLEMSVLFSGTRNNPEKRGSIKNIGLDNFTVENLVFATVEAIVNELYEMYEKTGATHKKLVGSGNGIRKGKAMQKIFEKKFNLPLELSECNEEAASGCALAAIKKIGEN